MKRLRKALALILSLILLIGTFSVTAGAKTACKHSYKTYVTQATSSKNGSTYKKCTKCGTKTAKTVIYKIKTVKLSSTSYVYDGKEKKPSVKIINSNGNTLKNNKDYTLKYSSGRTKVGSYSVKVTFIGKYKGSKTLKYKILPKGTNITSLNVQKNGFTVKWAKQATQTTGYQIQYSSNSDFSSAKILTVKSNKTTSADFSKLKYNQKYYVRVRTYKTVDDEKYYSSWSSKKAVTTEQKCSLVLDREDIVLFVDETAKINCTVSPEGTALTWTSSDTSVAKVSSTGTVLAVGEGTATITASFVYNGTTYEDICTVTVECDSTGNEDDIDPYDRVIDYINKNDDIIFRRTDKNGVAYGGLISIDDEGNLTFFISYHECAALVIYEKGSDTAFLVGVVYSDSNQDTEIVIGKTYLDVSTYEIGDDISFDDVECRPGYSSVIDTGLGYISAVTGLGFACWNDTLQTRVGVSFSDIGFKEVN